ncbi:MAG: sugar ABC transporter ATP-binding protein, partial [Verrucomicrobiales bacterium]
DHRTETKLAREWLARLGLDIDPEERCGDLSVARQQAVEIARALSFDARILVMDEPSAVLTDREVEKLFVNVRELRKEGIGIVYISHRLEEIDEIADRFLVLRDGKTVGEGRVSDSSREQLIELMVGRSLEKEFPPRSVEIGEEKLRVDRISQGKLVRDVSFSVRTGEIVGFFGLVGAGRTETMRLVAGADRCDSGEVFVEGAKVSARNPREAISAGICLLSEDRKAQGLVQKHTAMSNFGLPNLRRFSHGLVLKDGEEREEFSEYVESLRIRVSVPEQLAAQLSGGNQQKVVIAKWLARNTEVILFDEPTRGIDVGAKFEIYQLMNKLAGEGKAIVMVSSELPEILGMSDRIIVMREGQIAGELENRDGLTQEEVLALAMEREVAA